MYTYKFMKSVRVIPVSAVLSRVPYGYVFLHMGRIRVLHTELHIFAFGKQPQSSVCRLNPENSASDICPGSVCVTVARLFNLPQGLW